MMLTNDQYQALVLLEKWYRKAKHQFIDIAGVVGTGTWELIQAFIEDMEIDAREVMYLSYDQREVLELASRRYHAYYLDGIIYKYIKEVDFDSLPVVNGKFGSPIVVNWKKEVRKKFDKRYRLIVVFDSVLCDNKTLKDIESFNLPIILLRDPMMLPPPNTYTFLREPNVMLRELHPSFANSPIIHFAHKVVLGEDIKPGSYDTVSIIPRRQMNLYNLKACEMNIALTDETRSNINSVYRERVLHRKDTINIVGEKVIVMNDLYNYHITNQDEKRIKVYLRRGVVGSLTKINKHAASTKYVPIEFTPGFYDEAFDDLYIDRFRLNGIERKSTQMIPDNILEAELAYCLTPALSRLSHWNKVTVIADDNNAIDNELYRILLYTAITRSREYLNLVI